MNNNKKLKNIGFISTRIAGTDGVTLETFKWAKVLEQERYKCFYLAGELEIRSTRSYIVKKAHFNHPAIKKITQSCFGANTRNPDLTKEIHHIKEELKIKIYRFIEKFKIDILILENCLSIPINIPLGIAVTEVISESGMPSIAHHHDLYWERKKFFINSIPEYLNMAFPPNLPSIQHVVINSQAAAQLSFRSGISSTIIPNVMDFENEPALINSFAADVKENLGIKPDEFFILQPTRVIQRKKIERAIELVSRLKLKTRLVISHASKDEGLSYEKRVKKYAKIMKVNALFVSKNINNRRGRTKHNNKIYTLADVYPHADLITFPSSKEGFGNAFLEAVYFKKPIVINNYPVFVTDIKPRDFKVIDFNEFITEDTVAKTEKILQNPKLVKKWAEHNFELGKKFYSFSVLRRKLNTLIMNFNELNNSK
ncbi:MAG: glycosyltransferase family 4 protein [Patescibacteria group bacterium]|nr:glycosyltransferase family 4 protein [Patescibacteria group bacterium]